MELVTWLRTLTFGGSLGAAAGAWIWVHFPGAHQIEQGVVITIAAGIGLGFSSLIGRVFSPLASTAALYVKLAHLKFIKNVGIMPAAEVDVTARKMVQQYFAVKLESEKPKAEQVLGDLRKLLTDNSSDES